MYYLITFDSSNAAIAARKVLEKGFSVVTMPTLREITARCGISLRINPEDRAGVIKTLEDSPFIEPGIYELYAVDEKKITKIM